MSSRVTAEPGATVRVMAPYLPEPETATADERGVVRDDDGNAFSTDSYWLVAEPEAET